MLVRAIGYCFCHILHAFEYPLVLCLPDFFCCTSVHVEAASLSWLRLLQSLSSWMQQLSEGHEHPGVYFMKNQSPMTGNSMLKRQGSW
jgi:hypothetical protein